MISFIIGNHYPEIKHYLAIYPRNPYYLGGIFSTIFVHKDLDHFSSNILPLSVCLFGLYYFYKEIATKVLMYSYTLTGILIWLMARSAFHIGASGLVYALVFFVIIRGIIRRNKSLRVFALVILVFQSGLIWGIFPMENGVSWESHLFGALSGTLFAILYRNQGPKSDQIPNWNDDNNADDRDEYSEIL